MLLTPAMSYYFKNALSDNALYKAILSVEFKRDENDIMATEAIDAIEKIALKNQFTKYEFDKKVKYAQNYVYDQEMKEFAKTIRKR